MNLRDDEYYEGLADKAERGELPAPEKVLTGQEAANRGRALLMWATDTDTLDDAVKAARRGRPRLGPGEGRSPVVRGRVSADEYAALEALAERTGRSLSELVREGVALVLANA
ncbi:MAG: ribbon-helix-helix protein, CopG family [Bifidobacteriaceae bacterium]|jgi:hypothetical protein|nr:ribbon-helix-helix protein, CopG family [Bifidobacteriaceae bacterium]